MTNRRAEDPDLMGRNASAGQALHKVAEDGRAVAAVRKVAHVSVEERVARGKAGA